MVRLWKTFFNSKNIGTRILTRGVGLTVIPLALVVAVVWIVNGVANSVAVQGCYRLADQVLNRTVLSLLAACVQDQDHIASSLEGARVVVKNTGEVRFDSSEKVTWQAKNQFTNEVSRPVLPLMRVGAIALRPVTDFSKPAPIVDQIVELYGTTATIFQRMNDAGDMLRVSTTIKKADGSRAIGTYIPAMGADGKPNPVLSKVLKGESYLGRAFVVNSWYMAAYQPMKDVKGTVVGMIYTGLPESQVRDRIVKFKDQSASAGKTDMFVVHASAKAQGLFVLSDDPSLQDHQAWDYQDAKGRLYVQDVCKQALKLREGQIAEINYWAMPKDGKPSQDMLVRFVYFPAWDWVIGVEQPEDDFMALSTQIRHIFVISNFLPAGLVILATLAALAIWKRLTRQMTVQVEQVMTKLENSSKQFAQAIQSIGGHADSVGAAAEELLRSTQIQARSAEETSATTSSVTETARQNSDAAERMRGLSGDAESILDSAKTTLADVNAAMQSIVGTNDQALSIIGSINDISFATNIVALNASVEAAKAGDAGRTFAFIADEVRHLSAKVAAAAEETRIVINNARGEMDRGADFVTKLVLALGPMDENANQVRRLAVDVSTTSQSQASSMQQVLEAVKSIQTASWNAAQSAQRGSKDAVDLRSQVAALGSSVRAVDQAVKTLHEEFLSSH